MFGSQAPLGDSNSRLAAARRLTSARGRRAAGLFLAEGVQAVREALRRPGTVVEVFATAAALERHGDLLGGARVAEVSQRAAARLSETVTPQGLVAICRPVHVSLDEAMARRPRLVAVLVEPGDPGNAGTILRTADAAGAATVVFAGGVDVYGGKCVRASAGSLFHLDVVADADLDSLLAAARRAEMTTLAADGAGAQTLDELATDGTLRRPTMWLFGNEAHGLGPQAVAAADRSVRIPIYGEAESLNLASAATLCLYASAAAMRARERNAD